MGFMDGLVWVAVDDAGRIIGASVADGRGSGRAFFGDDEAVHLVVGPVVLFRPLTDYVIVKQPEAVGAGRLSTE